jgi:hypothetical protein
MLPSLPATFVFHDGRELRGEEEISLPEIVSNKELPQMHGSGIRLNLRLSQERRNPGLN